MPLQQLQYSRIVAPYLVHHQVHIGIWSKLTVVLVLVQQVDHEQPVHLVVESQRHLDRW